MKQKIVIKVQMSNDKGRSKAMQLAVAAGAESVAIEGEEKDQLVVIGDGVDSAGLTTILRKKVGHAHIIKVEEVKKKAKEESKAAEAPLQQQQQHHPYYLPPQGYVIDYDSHYSNPNTCSII